MGLGNYKIINEFISGEEANKIVDWIGSINHNNSNPNHHLSELGKVLKGNAYIFDITGTEATKYVTGFHSIHEVCKDPLPEYILNILDRIINNFNLPKDHLYLQAVDMREGGKINPHYDASIDGYINYKCNISVLSDDYELFIDNNKIDIKKGDVYGFEASLYKHWTNEFKSRRVLLSFGFMVPYNCLNRDRNDPRVRLSQRIEKYFQSEINNKEESTKD